MNSRHDEKVEAVCAQVRTVAARDEGVHIQKGGVHHVVPLPGDGRFRGHALDVSALNEILEIDPQARTCTAEPGATFAAVAAATLEDGLLPKVVPELEGITVGGAVAGCSVEAMSFKYGGFHDGCREYEVVTGTGERRTLTPGDELFHMLHGSYGTLGVLTKVVFDLVPAKPHVEMTYRKHGTFAAFDADLRERCDTGDFDLIDGIVHAPDELVLCLGRFVDAPAGPVSSYRGTEIYYRSTRTLQSDHMTTLDYCFRYDTECHWLSRTFPPLEWRPVRRLVGRWFLGSTNLIRWSNRVGRLVALVTRRPDVVVDVFIPGRRFADFWDWYVRDFAYWPLWIVPYRVGEPYPWINRDHAGGLANELMIDCAIYGKRNNKLAIDYSEAIERKTYELGGIKTLISRNHHTRDEFWRIYDRPRWEAAKQELDPNGLFHDLYEKFHAA